MSSRPCYNRIFGLGLSRTGTTSIAGALQTLGITQLHYPMDYRTYCELRQLQRGQDVKLTVLEKHTALLDITTVPFFKRLDRMYPGSKFIYTVREKERWLRSLKAHWDRGGRPISSQARDVWPMARLLFPLVYGSLDFDPERCWQVYQRHDLAVRVHFANRPQDLLVLDVTTHKNPWGPLCTFLHKPCPAAPFPHQSPMAQDRTNATAGFAPTDWFYPEARRKRHVLSP